MFNFRSNTPKVDMKSGFYNRCFFDLRLCEERRRTERSGLPFSVLSIEILDFADSIKKQSPLSLNQIKKAVSDMVRKNSRISDVKAWCSNTTLKILLPETSMTEAQFFSDKLHQKFNNGFRSTLGIGKTFDLKTDMLITSFPEVIKNAAGSPGETTTPVDKPKPAPVLKSSEEEATSTTLTMKWDPMDQMSLTWPLYSDLLRRHDLRNVEKWIKRGIDIAGALIGIIVFSPMMIIIAILIKATSCGPILFRQERLGFLGKKFTFLKFRSMYVNCSEQRHKEYVTRLITKCLDTGGEASTCKPTYKMNDDPRVTRVGKFLRRSSLDELPQFFNVLKGEMSLVGPRPPIRYEVEKYENWHLRRVLEVKPGITGLWQVEGRSSTTFDEMVRLDIAYVNHFSLWVDLKIMFKTLWAVFSAKGAY
jgi:lipopolysaccharide/colanic/teichoic acid biosynthesis glycosyltransferase/GGDEF domain-containing protein